METKYNLSQISKTLEKLFEAGFNNEKKILALKLEDLMKIPNIQNNDFMVIVEFKNAIKSKQVVAFLSGYKEKGKGEK